VGDAPVETQDAPAPMISEPAAVEVSYCGSGR
jgi:hypothetical protein